MAMKETDLFSPIKEWLEQSAFDVYAEVRLGLGGSIIDVIGIHEVQDSPRKIVMAIEMKSVLNLDVLAQARNNRHYVDYSYVFTPALKGGRVTSKGRFFAYDLAEKYGIGILLYNPNAFNVIQEKIEARLNHDPAFEMLEPHLLDEQKDSIAGTKNEYVSYLNIILGRIIDYVKERGAMGATSKEIFESVEGIRWKSPAVVTSMITKYETRVKRTFTVGRGKKMIVWKYVAETNKNQMSLLLEGGNGQEEKIEN